MKFVILHGTDASHQSNWFPWLKQELEALGHEVWVPDLPGANRPSTTRYNDFLLSSGYDFNNVIIIGHSAGAVAILGLLQALPENTTVHAAVLAGSFTKRLSESPSWEILSELFTKPFDFEAIKKKSDKFIFIHSKDDPYCPIDQAEFLQKKIGGEFIRFKDKGHFSKNLDPTFDKFPEILDILKQKVL